MDDTIDYLQSHNVKLLKKGEIRESRNSTLGATVGMLWMDIEGTSVSTPTSPLLIIVFVMFFILMNSTGPLLPVTM